ncbi:DUF7507 domain-containing protein [Sedimentibacter saalensis]|uniref:LPXTG-motif cell wall-anchored protein/uncharacterized repeat protein (TIGR01451 family) n=1 Tax=Sedimentibacter saalensis TaxID=130788 RepID=A0A562J3D9_9FIRM|nr:LPXTG cell wall anchor domain-containing protein [Sedimentibacter saalensis]TWH77662.1 LPXTG-motif cell wall-anchored protein/uncharacterized repeat protein (TIGR01451 family) [Sedimentibacter saalensis]
MRKINTHKRILAIVLSVMLITLGIPLTAQATTSNWKQFADESGNQKWINGDLNRNNSTYTEGRSVPQRLILNDITTGSGIHYVDFEYQFTKGGKYAYDFIVGYDQAESTSGHTWDEGWIWYDIDEEDIERLNDNVTYIPIPTNNYATEKEDAFEDTNGERRIYIYSNKPLTDASITMNNQLDGDLNKDSTLGFTVSWEGDADEVMIIYASHIAMGVEGPEGWGLGMGASEINGSPYHNKLGPYSSEWKGSRSQDNQLQIKDGPETVYGKIEVTKTASPLTMAEPGGEFTYTYVVKNIGTVPVTLTSVVDDIIGPIELPADVELAPGESTAAMTAKHTYTDDGVYTNTVIATAKDNKNNTITDTDSAEVTVTDTLPSITVTKVANPTSLPKSGGVFTYTYVVKNNGIVPVTVTSVEDNVIGTITLPADVELAPGESTTAMTGVKTYTEPGTYSNTVTAKAEDDDENEATATAVASVTVTNSDASIIVTKTADPIVMAEPGGEFTYTYVVKNNGNIPVTVTSVIDDVIGVITLPSDVELAPGESTAAMTGKHTYTDDGVYTNIVTVKAVNGEDEVTNTASATVTVTDTKPIISVTKTANPTSMAVPGGQFTYTYIVKNIGTVPVTVTSVEDNVIGKIKLPDDVNLEPGESTIAMTGTKIYTEIGTYPNTVVAKAVDDDENEVTASANVSVTVTRASDPDDDEDEDDEDDDDGEDEEEDLVPIEDPDVPRGEILQVPDEPSSPDVPVEDETIEESAVPKGTLPDTGSVFNTWILAAIGLFMIIAGIIINKKNKVQG